jgi:hypothetical protein
MVHGIHIEAGRGAKLMDAIGNVSVPKSPKPGATPLLRRLQIWQRWAGLESYPAVAERIGLGHGTTWSNIFLKSRQRLPMSIADKIRAKYPRIKLEWLFDGDITDLHPETLDELRESAAELGPQFLRELDRPVRR